MNHTKINLLITELYLGQPCAQRHYLGCVLHFLADHPNLLCGTAVDLCKAMRHNIKSFYGTPVRWQHIYTVLRQCDINLTAQGITPGGTMQMLRTLAGMVLGLAGTTDEKLPWEAQLQPSKGYKKTALRL